MNFALKPSARTAFHTLRERCLQWSRDHQAEMGVAEVALGAAVIAWGVHSGTIQLGTQVVGTQLSHWGIVGSVAGAGLGAIGSSILGAIGVAGAYTFGIPALVLGLGGGIILAAAGYGVGAVAQSLLAPTPGWTDLLVGGSSLYLGIALMIDGATRITSDKRILRMASRFSNGVIELRQTAAAVVATTEEQLQRVVAEYRVPISVATAGLLTASGAVIGKTVAVSTVSVLGSHALGGLALSVGLAAPPLWPVIACAVAGLACAVTIRELSS